MSRFIAPLSGQLTLGLCDRCQRKHQLSLLKPDQDKPSLRVCEKCNDQKDPWRVPPRRPEDITVRGLRPEQPLEA